MKRSYHTVTKIGQPNARRLAEFLSRNGQVLLPMVDLIEQSRLAVDELIDVAGRATIEAVLELSAYQVAGPRTPGPARGSGMAWPPMRAGVLESRLTCTEVAFLEGVDGGPCHAVTLYAPGAESPGNTVESVPGRRVNGKARLLGVR